MERDLFIGWVCYVEDLCVCVGVFVAVCACYCVSRVVCLCVCVFFSVLSFPKIVSKSFEFVCFVVVVFVFVWLLYC